MLQFLFTIDYEIFGNGTGSLARHIQRPAERLLSLFRSRDLKLVLFVEPLELQKIEEYSTDAALDDVLRQIRESYEQGFEIALHLHPQWSRAVHNASGWVLDYSEYNICVLKPERINRIFEEGLAYLRQVVHEPRFIPVSFRAGNWLFQPTWAAARVLQELGIGIDSSVFGGGVQRSHGLDYRQVPRGEFFWRFDQDVTRSEADGPLLEVPIHTRLVPSWRMVTGKRMKSQGQKGHSQSRTFRQQLNRVLDLARFHYPLKLDFCRMTLPELTGMMDELVNEDKQTPERYRPVVAIGHTKDLVDFGTVEALLDYLQSKGIPTVDFRDVERQLSLRPKPPQYQPSGC